MKELTKSLKINSSRLWSALQTMASVGPGLAGGNNRQALTDADAEGRKLLEKWCLNAGLKVSVDEMGNMFAVRKGLSDLEAPVYFGSHLDTQPTGGKYDGVLGVLAGLEIVQTLNDLNIWTKHPLVLVNWTNEEGTRFPPPMMGSGVFSGQYSKDWAYSSLDQTGKTFGEELRRIDWVGSEKVGARKMKAFFELHIEQGPILEEARIDVGVVVKGQGASWLQLTLIGQESHSGSTPMSIRRDAGLGLAQITQLVNNIAVEYRPDGVGTIGKCDFYPNSPNIIAGKVIFVVDLRSPCLSSLNAMVEKFKKNSYVIAEDLGLEITIEEIGHFKPVDFDRSCIDIVRNAAKRLGYSHKDMVSGAGHDAFWISQVAPTAMIMCPCVGGLSHNEAEEITQEWAIAGTNVLLHAVLDTAEIGNPLFS